MKIQINYKNGAVAIVAIMKHKGKEEYSYVNLTKEHICPCVFSSIDAAIADLQNYKNIENWFVIER